MSKKIITVLIVLAIILVSGCTGPNGIFSQKEAGPDRRPFTTGMQGLAISFDDSAPPKNALYGDSFPVTLTVKNKGATAIPTNGLKLTFSNPQTFGIIEITRLNSEPLEATQLYQAGTETTIDFGEATFKGLPPATEEPKAIAVDACYPYQTRLSAQLCADNKRKICDPAAPKTYYSSAAPILVSDYKQISARKDPTTGKYDLTFSFRIKNAGAGKPYKAMSCDSPLSSENKDTIAITGLSYLYPYETLQCSSPTTQIKLTADKEGKAVTCAMKGVVVDTEAEGQLRLVLGYAYAELIKTSINIMPQPLESGQLLQ